jgi:hypothetical protein
MNLQCSVIQRIFVVDAYIRIKPYEVCCRKCRNQVPDVSLPSPGERISNNTFFVKGEVRVITMCSFRRNIG